MAVICHSVWVTTKQELTILVLPITKMADVTESHHR